MACFTLNRHDSGLFTLNYKVNSFTEMIDRIIKELNNLAATLENYSTSITKDPTDLLNSVIPCGSLFDLAYIVKNLHDVSLALNKCMYGCNRTETVEVARSLQRLSKRLTAVLAYWYNDDSLYKFYIQLIDRCNINMIYCDFVNNILTNGYKTKTCVMLPMQQLHIDYISSEYRFIVYGCKIDIKQCWTDVIKLLHNDAYTYLTDDINNDHDIVSVDNRTFIAYCKNGTNTIDMSVHQGSINIIESTPTDIVKESLILLIIACYCNHAAGSININIDKAYINQEDYKVNIPDDVALSDQQEMYVYYNKESLRWSKVNETSSSKVNETSSSKVKKDTTFLQFIDNLSYTLQNAV